MIIKITRIMPCGAFSGYTLTSRKSIMQINLESHKISVMETAMSDESYPPVLVPPAISK